MKPLSERLKLVPGVGRVTWLGVRPEHGAPMQPRTSVELITELGVNGDVAARGKPGHNRQVTLLQAEHLAVLAALTGAEAVRPEQLRRNLVVAGINLIALGRLRFAVGDAILVGTGNCAPCQKLDETLGIGGFQAARGHGGITARVERGAIIELGASVRVLGD